MKKIIEQLDKERGIKRVTVADERFYVFEEEDAKTKLPRYEYVPSVTWIAGHYPKGTEFYKWLANHGWDESQAIKTAAGDKGSKVHYAITDLLGGNEIRMEAKYTNPSTGELEELSLEEWECLMAFERWFLETKPETIANETVVRHKTLHYAGTIDYVCKIGGEKYLIDFKTGQNIWPEYELQVSAYKHALGTGDQKDLKLAMLQLGYRRNKNKYKFTEVEDKFELFKAAQLIWQNEVSQKEPLARDYPVKLSLGITKELSK